MIIDSSCLSATHTTGLASALVFQISEVLQGQFSWMSSPNQMITSFYQQNVTDGRVQFTHDNSTLAPAYRVSVTDGRVKTSPVSAEIDFDAMPLLLNNNLRIDQGQTVLLSSANLSATQPLKNDSALIFLISEVTHGQFNWVNDSSRSITNFTQQALISRQIQFSHDDSVQPPEYAVVVTDGRISTTPQAAEIDFDARPVLVNNDLTIKQAQALVLTSAELLAMHNEVADGNLLFNLSNLTHASIWVQPAGVQAEPILFTQQTLAEGHVTILQDGSALPPGYAVSVSDGRIQTAPSPCAVTFYKKPVITTNQLFLPAGKAMTLTTDNLCAEQCTQTTSDNLVFIVANIPDYGQFELVGSQGKPITSFSQKQVKQGFIQFRSNGTTAPRYQLSVSDPVIQLSSSLSVGQTLLLLQNNWPINQGEVFTLSATALNATSNGGGDILYTPVVGTINHGYFALGTIPKDSLPSFQQSQVTRGEVIFMPDNTIIAPTAVLAITDGTVGGAHGSFACAINFAVPPILEHAFYEDQSPG